MTLQATRIEEDDDPGGTVAPTAATAPAEAVAAEERDVAVGAVLQLLDASRRLQSTLATNAAMCEPTLAELLAGADPVAILDDVDVARARLRLVESMAEFERARHRARGTFIAAQFGRGHEHEGDRSAVGHLAPAGPPVLQGGAPGRLSRAPTGRPVHGGRRRSPVKMPPVVAGEPHPDVGEHGGVEPFGAPTAPVGQQPPALVAPPDARQQAGIAGGGTDAVHGQPHPPGQLERPQPRSSRLRPRMGRVGQGARVPGRAPAERAARPPGGGAQRPTRAGRCRPRASGPSRAVLPSVSTVTGGQGRLGHPAEHVGAASQAARRTRRRSRPGARRRARVRPRGDDPLGRLPHPAIPGPEGRIPAPRPAAGPVRR